MVTRLARRSGTSPGAVAMDAVLGQRVRNAFEERGTAPTSKDIQDLVTRATQTKDGDDPQREIQLLRGQVANLRIKLTGIGKGTEMPACWASPVDGKPEYIFQVNLQSSAIVVEDRKLPNHVEDQALLPITPIQFSQAISASDFLAQTRPIYDWSVAHGCRFFVIIADQTGPAEKARYKQQVRTIETHFYKFEPAQ